MTNDTPTMQLAVWDDPLGANGLQTDTGDALITGRDAIFVPCECVLDGAR